jgi:hypothetical protein
MDLERIYESVRRMLSVGVPLAEVEKYITLATSGQLNSTKELFALRSQGRREQVGNVLSAMGKGAMALADPQLKNQPARTEFVRGGMRGVLKGVTDFVAGGFDLFGADPVAEGIRKDREVAMERIGLEESESGFGVAGEITGQLITTLAPFMGAAKAAQMATKAAPRLTQLFAEGLSGAPLAAALATDPELSFFQDMPEGARVALEGSIDAIAGSAFAALPIITRGGREAVRLTRYTKNADPKALTGIKGAEDLRRANDPNGFINRYNFYVDGTGEPERNAAGLAYRHDVEVPRDRLYDYQTDPEGLVAKAAEELGVPESAVFMGTNQNHLESMVRDRGYLGAIGGQTDGGRARVVQLYDIPDDLDVQTVRQVGPGRKAKAEEVGGPSLMAKDEQLAALHAERGGATFDPRTGSDMLGHDKWAVATPTQSLFDEAPTPQQILEFRAKHAEELLDPKKFIGTWNDSETGFAHGKHELNITELYDDQDTALAIARERGEQSILNLGDPGLQLDEIPDDVFVAVDDNIAHALKRAQLDDEIPARAEARAERFLSNLTPVEAKRFQRLPEKHQASTLRAFSLMPTARETVSAALVGGEAQHWYETSAHALRSVFGEDTPRFMAMLAAASPQTSVEDNLKGSLQIWKRWDDAGRPTEKEAITGIIQDVMDEGGAMLVPKAINNNVSRVLGQLTDEQLMDPQLLAGAGKAKDRILSGPKVDAFYANLMGEVQRATIDTHMLRGFGANVEKATATRLLSTTAGLREAAGVASRLTGRTVTPREMQAMTWATFKALSDRLGTGAQRRGRSVADVVEGTIFEGGPAQALAGDIAETPSFSSILNNEDVAPLIRNLGPEYEPPNVVPSRGLVADPDLIREADIMGFAQRMDKSLRGEFLFGISALMAGAAMEEQEAGMALAAAGLAVPGGGRGRRFSTLAEAFGDLMTRATPDVADQIQMLRKKGMRFLPAFQDPDTGKVIPTGFAHDINEVPFERQKAIMDAPQDQAGFFDITQGKFLTRDETSAIMETPGESSMVRMAEMERLGLDPVVDDVPPPPKIQTLLDPNRPPGTWPVRRSPEDVRLDAAIEDMERLQREGHVAGPILTDLMRQGREIRQGVKRAPTRMAWEARLANFIDRNPGLLSATENLPK